MGEVVAECPFCGGEVDEDLITFGGSCPKCFGHIPGEEAATDPGEEVKAQQDAQDRKRTAFRAIVPIMVMVPVVLCAGLGALYMVLRPEPEVAILDFDELDEYYMPEIVAGEAVPEPSPEPAPTQVAASPKPVDAGKYVPRSDVVSGGVGGADLVGGDAVADAGGAPRVRPNVGPVGPAGLEANGGGGTRAGTPTDFGLALSGQRSGKPLDDPDQVRDMIAKKMAQQIQTLNICYERQLKVVPTLQGKWRIKYTVKEDGTTDLASAEGLGASDAEFEACMADQMIRWRFSAIANDQRVQRTVSFRPGSF